MTGFRNFATTGIVSFSNVSGQSYSSYNTGYPYNIPNFAEYEETCIIDNRPDFEKAYDIYIKNKEEGKVVDPKQMFIEASKIAFAMAKLRNDNN